MYSSKKQERATYHEATWLENPKIPDEAIVFISPRKEK